MAIAATVLVDFGGENITESPTDGRFWNNITDPVSGSVVNAVTAERGAPTGFSVTITVPFRGIDETGGAIESPSLPVSAVNDSFFGDRSEQGVGAFSEVTISGLASDQTYSLSLYASAAIDPDRVLQHRSTYSVTGLDTMTFDDYRVSPMIFGTLEGATFEGVVPDASGRLHVNISNQGSLFDPDSGFYHLGVLEIEFIPEPSTCALLLLALTPFLMIRRRPRGS